MGRASYIETECRTALNRVKGMPFAWSLNPYRGCTHSCHYCYARATHAYYGMNADEDFESRIVVKTNFAAVLRQELARRSWRHESVALGTATDAYQPCEGRFRITRAVLEALRDARNPLSIVTKSTLIVRDLDILAELARAAAVRVYFTITTVDPVLWRIIEPGTPHPLKRLQIMQRLNAAGIPAGVFMAPILPGITDSIDAIEAVAAAASHHGAVSFGSSPLRLAPLVKEHYLDVIATTFPDLLPRYQRAYSGANAPVDYRDAIDRRVAHIRQRHGFAADSVASRERDAIDPPSGMPSPPVRTGQLALLM